MANKTNAKRGALFEEAVGRFLSAEGVRVTPKFKLHIGVSDQKCSHEFDFGSDESNIVVECKCHSWTEGGNSPSAKLATWNEAMYYFSLVPDEYRKMMFVLLSRFDPEKGTLLEKYIRSYPHLIPHDVEIWEFDESLNSAKQIHGPECHAL
ncbi:MAG: hypothetical protein WCI46_15260 [Verrucomicrobiota bacterium]